MPHAMCGRAGLLPKFFERALSLLIVLGSCRLVHCGGGLNQSDPRGVMSLKCEGDSNICSKSVSRAPSFSGKLPVLTFRIANCAPFATAALIAVGLSSGGTFLSAMYTPLLSAAHSRVRRSAKLFISWKASLCHSAKLKNLSLYILFF
jgi:hypothetical protein